MIRVRYIITVKYEMLICYQRHHWWFLVESEPCYCHLVNRNNCIMKTLFICLKINNLCCENSVCSLIEEWFYSANIGGIIDNSFWKRTVPLSCICVMGNGPIVIGFLIEYYRTPWELPLWKGVLSQLWFNYVGRCSSCVNRKRWAFPLGYDCANL